MITNPNSGTNVQEIANGIYRINTPIEFPGGAGWFSFNQYLIDDVEPLLFHSGPRKLFPLVRDAIASVISLDKLRYVGLSHVEADECGAINELMAMAPRAVPVCGRIAAMVSIADLCDRAPRVLEDRELLSLGSRKVRWFDTPHMPHGWDCGLLMKTTTDTFFCGDLFTQPGRGEQALIESDIFGPSEAFRQPMDYFAHAPHTTATLARLAAEAPITLACMHGSAWRGDGAALLYRLGEALDAGRQG